MLTIYPPSTGRDALTAQVVSWIDLFRPTDDERRVAEERCGLRLPTRAELSEVELSSRVAEQDEVLFLNVPAVSTMGETDQPLSPVGFVLSKDLLVTIRYAELRSFDMVVKKFAEEGRHPSSVDTFVSIIDEMVDVSADLLEILAAELESISRSIFSGFGRQLKKRPPSNAELEEVLVRIGQAGERLSRIRDIILSLRRIATFVAGSDVAWIPQGIRTHLATPASDLLSLSEFETNLSDKTQFLLDAVLGFVNIKQNDIFQNLTVISIVGIPPTLVASIYGMNFRNMPELTWAWGYQWGLALILLSAVLPILWFKWKKWV